MTPLRGILRGAAPLTALEALSVVLAMATLPYLMRVLGPADFGRYAFGVAAGVAMAALVDYGFNQLGPRVVAQAADIERRRIFWSVQAAKAGLALLALPALGLLAWLLDLHSRYGEVLAPATLAVLAALVFPQWFLQGAQRFRLIATCLAAARIGSAAGTLMWVRAPADVALAVALQTVVGAAAGLLALTDLEYRGSLRYLPPRPGQVVHWLRRGLPLFLSTAAVAAYTTCVPLVLGILTTPASVGLFSVGDKIRAAVQTLLAPIGVAAYPELSRRMREDRQQALGTARQLLVLQLGLALAAAAAIFVLAEPVIRLVIGEAFLPAVATARLLGLCLLCTAVSNSLGVQIMLPMGMERSLSAILGVGAATGIAAAWLLSPHWHEWGAALAVLGAELAVAILMAALLRRRRLL